MTASRDYFGTTNSASLSGTDIRGKRSRIRSENITKSKKKVEDIDRAGVGEVGNKRKKKKKKKKGPNPGSNRGPRAYLLRVDPWRYR